MSLALQKRNELIAAEHRLVSDAGAIGICYLAGTRGQAACGSHSEQSSPSDGCA
jgi:hypothetical protein